MAPVGANGPPSRPPLWPSPLHGPPPPALVPAGLSPPGRPHGPPPPMAVRGSLTGGRTHVVHKQEQDVGGLRGSHGPEPSGAQHQ